MFTIYGPCRNKGLGHAHHECKSISMLRTRRRCAPAASLPKHVDKCELEGQTAQTARGSSLDMPTVVLGHGIIFTGYLDTDRT